MKHNLILENFGSNSKVLRTYFEILKNVNIVYNAPYKEVAASKINHE